MKTLLAAIFVVLLTSIGHAETQTPAKQITVNTSSFSKNLNSSDTNVQAALNTLDQTGGGGGISGVNWGQIGGVLSNQSDLNTALNEKQATITTGTTSQYLRGDLSLATFPTNLSSFTNGPGYLTANQTITLSGDITGSGTTAITGTLANTTVTPGSYTNANLTVNSKGLVTAASNGAGPSGTVTAVSVNASNGLAGSVSNPTTTPAITLSTTVTGILKGNGTAISAATSNTDYQAPLTFSTGLTDTSNTVTVNTSQNIGTLSNLTSNGFVKTSGGTGALSIDTNNYLTSNQNINWAATGNVTGSGNGTTSITVPLTVNWANISAVVPSSSINWQNINLVQTIAGAINWMALPQSIQSNNVNWSSLNSVINSSYINWYNINALQTIAGAVNWSALANAVQSNNINWASVNTAINSAALNWTNINSIKTITNAINWQALPSNVQNSNINWYSMAGYNPGYFLTATSGGSVNWQAFQTGGISGVNWGQITGTIANQNWQSPTPYLNMGAINWNDAQNLNYGVNWYQINLTTSSLKTTGNMAGIVQLWNQTNTNYVNWTTNSGLNANYAIKWPANAPSANTIPEITDSFGDVNWVAVSGVIGGAANWSQLQGNPNAINWQQWPNSFSGAQGINWSTMTSYAQPIQYGGSGVGYIRLYDSSGINWVALQAPGTINASINWTFPSSDGTNGQCLETNGNKVLSFGVCSGGGGGLSSFTSPNATIAIGGTLTAPTVDINWTDVNKINTIASGGINWADVGAHALLNMGGINWTNAQIGQSVNWSSGTQIASTFKAVSSNGLPNLQMFDTYGINWVGLSAPGTINADINWTLPSLDGSTGQYLKTNGSKILGWSNSEQTISYQPGLLTGVVGTTGVYGKFVNTSTVDNIIGSAISLTCTGNPVITLYECGSSTTCGSPTTIGSVTITATGTAYTGTILNPTITAGDYIGWATTSGTCSTLDISASAQVHSN